MKIAVLDTGVALAGNSRPRITEETWMGMSSICGESKILKNGLNFKEDEDGHGTDCFYLLKRVCPYARIYPYRIMNTTSTDEPINSEFVKEALEDAIDKNVDIISISFGWDVQKPGLYEIFVSAKEKNILVFAATSNDGGRIKYPAF